MTLLSLIELAQTKIYSLVIMNTVRRKSAEISKRLDQLAQQLRSNPLQKANRPTNYEKGSLEAKVASSPYAAILASPIRSCRYHRRYFPSEMLLRFGLVRDPKSNKLLPVPQVKRHEKMNGIGRYVRLRRAVFDHLGPRESRAIFMGKAEFQKDIVDAISRQLVDNAYKLYQPSTYVPLISIERSLWQAEQPREFQCILISNDSDPFCELDHRIITDTTTHKVPCYNVGRLWDDTSMPLAYGVPKQISTVELAVALWKCRAFFNNNM
ncbi:hypothetical protein BJV82DRAFT_175397 [Fennellomyces sp. T-0311]|nr:hypothetical protein BJV82DRAFT_175397 [Fennellomyces sp. T-0311]